MTADLSKFLKSVQSDITFIYDILSQLRVGFASFLVILPLENVACFTRTSVCNFSSMKGPVELNSLLSKFRCCITWFVISPD